MDTLADGDELRGFGISLLVVCVEIVADLDGRDGGSDLLEVQRSIGVDNLLCLCRLLGSGSSLCGSLVLTVFEVLVTSSTASRVPTTTFQSGSLS